MNFLFTIRDHPGAYPAEGLRKLFEETCNGTPILKENTKLETELRDNEFQGYTDPDTDFLWAGFALGMRVHERLNRSQQTHEQHAQATTNPTGGTPGTP